MRSGPRLRRLLVKLASIPDHDLSPDKRHKLPLFHRSLLPVLSLASSLYGFSLFVRRSLYRWGILRKHRLPVPVVSVGNLTWGGNGKTPMAEFLARFFANAGISPLILMRGYAGGDEAAMLCRHLSKASVRMGVGANRVAVAADFFDRYGYICYSNRFLDKNFSKKMCGTCSVESEIGISILDDGLQHWGLLRNLDIIMVNGMMPWGNGHLLPRGTLREPLDAIKRADIGVIHHADLVSDRELKAIEATMLNIQEALPIFFSRLAPSSFFDVHNIHSVLPLRMVENMVVLCISAIGFPTAFSQHVKKEEGGWWIKELGTGGVDVVRERLLEVVKEAQIRQQRNLGVGPAWTEMGALHVDQLDFMDHHFIHRDDIELIRQRLRNLERRFRTKAVVIVTEKDYDRDPAILRELHEFKVLVICSSLEIMPFAGQTVENFEELLMKILHRKIVNMGIDEV